MRRNLCPYSREAQSPKRMKMMRASSKQEDTVGFLSVHVRSEDHSLEEERPMRTERAVTVSHRAFKYTIAGLPGLTEDAVTAWVTPEGHNGLKWTENRVQAMLQDQSARRSTRS